jgi:hypothetical protein
MKRPRKTLNDRLKAKVWPTRAQANNDNAYNIHEWRCKNRIHEVITQPNPTFMTWTLDNDHINRPIEKTLRDIKKALNKLGATQYIINTDYGDKTGRLHFHVIATFQSQLEYITKKNQKYIPNIHQLGYKNGHVHVKFISHETGTNTRIQKYITKSYNHAHKQTAGVIIYSRRKKPHDQH